MDPWAAVVAALVQVLPSALREFRQMQHERMQWQAHLASKGIVLGAPAAPAPLPQNGGASAEVQPPPPPPNQSTEQAGTHSATFEQVIAGMVNHIVKYREQGWDGHACAAALAVDYAEFLPLVAPMLSSREQVEAFIVNTPALAELASKSVHPEQQTWEDFVDDFFWTLNPDQAPEEEEDGDAEIIDAEPSATERKAPKAARQKKVAAVGRVV